MGDASFARRWPTSGDRVMPSPQVRGGVAEGRNRLVRENRRQTKRCSDPPLGCGRERDLSDFYDKRIVESTGHIISRYRCKECTKEASRTARLISRGRAIFLVRDTERILVVFPVEPEFVLEHEPEPETSRFPMYGVTPLCSRGDHEWPIETVCRGYEALGCEGAGPHVHRRCVAHSCEEIEMAPMGLRRRT